MFENSEAFRVTAAELEVILSRLLDSPAKLKGGLTASEIMRAASDISNVSTRIAVKRTLHKQKEGRI